MSKIANIYARICVKYKHGADITSDLEELGSIINLMEHKNNAKTSVRDDHIIITHDPIKPFESSSTFTTK